MMQLVGKWSYPTEIHFGAGKANDLVAICQAHGIQKPLIVTDPGLAILPVMQQIRDILTDGGMSDAAFHDMRPNPVGRDVEAGVAVYHDGGHDGVIAFGGGSALDVGKAIAFMAEQTRPIWDFEDIGDYWTRANAEAIAPVIAIPTTAGTGSEVGRASVIIDERDHRKVIVFHPKMMPVAVIADPELTVGLPAKLTAATGLDAFTHSLEAYCSPHYHPFSQGIALEGMQLVKGNLQRAYDDGSDIDARSHMLAASMMGATAFQKGLGAVHALSHPIGALFNTHHGLTNAVLLPYVLRRNQAAIEARLTDAGRYLNLTRQGFEGFFSWVMEMRESMGIVHTLAELGVAEEAVQEVADAAKKDPSDGGNPIDLSVADYAEIYRRAYAGNTDGY